MSANKDVLKAKWDEFSDVYARHYEPRTLVGSMTLFSAACVTTGKDVLEIGCGGGLGTTLLASAPLNTPATPFRVTAVDLSPKMVEITKARLTEKLGADASTVTVQVADMCALPFEDNSFDRVVANLCFFMPVDTDLVLAEALRVLRPGGVLAFSVWGDKAKSPYFTAWGQACAAAGVVDPLAGPPGGRSNFHLADAGDDAMRTRLLAAGFQTPLVWHAPLPIGSSAEETVHFLTTYRMPSILEKIAAVPAADMAKITEHLTRILSEWLERGNGPIGLDLMCCVGNVPREDAAPVADASGTTGGAAGASASS